MTVNLDPQKYAYTTAGASPTTSAQTLRQLAEKRLETINGLIEDLDAELADIKNNFEDLEYPIRETQDNNPFEGLTISAEVEQIIPEIEQIAGAAEEILRQCRLLEFEAAAAEQLRYCTDQRECLEVNRYVEDYESEINRSVLLPVSNTGKLEAVRKPFNVLSPAMWRHAKDCHSRKGL